jgi:hypothetical protein
MYKAHPINTMDIPQFTKNKEPFDVKIKVRSAAHAALIERECVAATTVRY